MPGPCPTDMPAMLKPVKPQRVSEQVFAQLRDLIQRGQLQPGERLLPEREMARVFGVSRPSVREAIHRLISLGLVEHHQGQGTFIRATSVTAPPNLLAALVEAEQVSLLDLLEVRLGLECQAAALAAQRATAADLENLSRCLEELGAENRAGRPGIAADVAFHRAVAQATKNPVYIYLMRTFADLLQYAVRANLHWVQTQTRNLTAVTQQHQDILTAISSRDPAGAQAAMQAHITYVAHFFRQQHAGTMPVSISGAED